MIMPVKSEYKKSSMRHETIERVTSPRETDKQEGKKLKGETEDMKPAKETNEQHGKVSSAPLV